MFFLRLSSVFITGLAMFSMFFGAGNVVFPLIVGRAVGEQAWSAIGGLFLTAVGVPFLGLVALTLYGGDYRAFLGRLGRVPGFLLAFFMLLILGPIGAIPRCIALSCGTLKMYIPMLSRAVFSLVACVVIYMATCRRNRMVGLLGAVLSPLLVTSLAVIIVKGLLAGHEVPLSTLSSVSAFSFGLAQGYNTMDLLAAFFFSGVIITSLRQREVVAVSDTWGIARYALLSSLVGASLLGLVYAGFALVAAQYGKALSIVAPEALLGTIASSVLGAAGGLFVSATVILACVTTAITLTAVFAEFLQEQVFSKTISYNAGLLLTLVVTFVFANLEFGKIVSQLVPVLIVIYPALLVLTIINILHKMYGVSMIKMPVAIVAIASIIWHQVPQLLTYLGLAA